MSVERRRALAEQARRKIRAYRPKLTDLFVGAKAEPVRSRSKQGTLGAFGSKCRVLKFPYVSTPRQGEFFDFSKNPPKLLRSGKR